MEKILVSACLAGDVVRYDGKCVPLKNKYLELLGNKGCMVKCCPEVAGGMSIPRAPAQIAGGNGSDVLAGRAGVMDINGKDVSRFFIKGAESALSVVRAHHSQVVLLKDKSPSCGSHFIYDGTFGGRLICGDGVTAAILKQNNVYVFSDSEIQEFEIFVKQSFL
ncbi:MAG: DUF523 domain-containing protein [Desulfobacula sp.]|nr:DUF523 domain-containing protein [Desulfobacula sp.]